MTGSFHPNSDINKLYISRKSGGRGLKSIKILFESRTLALRQHLRQSREKSDILTCVYELGETNIVRLGNELLQSHEIQDDHDETAKAVSKKYIINKQKQLINNYTSKKMHCYFFKKLRNDETIDKNVSNSGSAHNTITSHFEGYINAIQDQEIPTKYLANKRQKDANLQPTCNKRATNLQHCRNKLPC